MQIKIVDLAIFARHGVYAPERADGQVFLVSAELELEGLGVRETSNEKRITNNVGLNQITNNKLQITNADGDCAAGREPSPIAVLPPHVASGDGAKPPPYAAETPSLLIHYSLFTIHSPTPHSSLLTPNPPPSAHNADALTSTVDYAEACRDISEFMTVNTFNLIETAADGIARLLLKKYGLLNAAQIEVKKPDAPIGMPLKYVSAVCRRARHTAFIGLGSNMGAREQNLSDALALIAARDDCTILKVSEFQNTAPYGKAGQPDFLNACAKISTVLTPWELLGALQGIERRLGRARAEHWGPRTLDVDILFYDDLILSEPALTVPHYDLHNRRFVLDALCGLEPFLLHPVFRMPVCALRDTLAKKQR